MKKILSIFVFFVIIFLGTYHNVLAANPTISAVELVPTPTNDPEYTFNTDQEGTITYGGDCSATTATTVATIGDNTITFSGLSDATYSSCTVMVTNTSLEDSNILSVDTFILETVAPVLTQVTPVSTPTTDTTPDYTFDTDEAGTITYGGSCASILDVSVATAGNKTITFDKTILTIQAVEPLIDATYSDCTIKVTDEAGNISEPLTVDSFTVETGAPTLSQLAPISTPTSDTTPNYSFYTDEAGTINYSGDCASTTLNANAGNNTITFDTPLLAELHSNCYITVNDGDSNLSNSLHVSDFTIKEVPSINNVTGVINGGNSITISGADFGDKSVAAPLRYDNFEGGTADLAIPSDQPGGGWSTESHNGTNALTWSDETVRFPGTLSAKQSYDDEFAGAGISLDNRDDVDTIPETNEMYVSGWFWFDTWDGLTNNTKFINMGVPDPIPAEHNGWQTRLDGNQETDNGLFYAYMSDDCSIEGTNGQKLKYEDYHSFENYFQPNSSWHRIETYLRIGSDGYRDIYIDGVKIGELMGNFTSNNCELEYVLIGHYFRLDYGVGDPTGVRYWDELYVDTTQARVEICEDSIFSNCTHKEIQIPTSWNDITGEIEVTLNEGSLDTLGGKYIYVIDSDGTVSNSYLLDADTTPDAFTFTNITGATTSTQYTSDTITVAGIDAGADATIEITTCDSIGTCEYELNNSGSWTSTSGTVNLGDIVKVRQTSSSSYGTQTDLTLSIGGVEGTHSVTTYIDTTPDAFTFTNITGATTSTVYTSNSITVAGIDAGADATIEITTCDSIGTCEYELNNSGSWTSTSGTVNLGDIVKVRQTSSSSYGTQTDLTLSIGGVEGTYSVTTLADTTAPIISQLAPISTPTSDTTPNYIFTTDEAGTINYSGDCTSTTFLNATVGNNTITFDALSVDEHSNCQISVTDSASNISNTVDVTNFTIKNPPSINDVTGALINGGSITISGSDFSNHDDFGGVDPYLNYAFEDIEAGVVATAPKGWSGDASSTTLNNRSGSTYSAFHERNVVAEYTDIFGVVTTDNTRNGLRIDMDGIAPTHSYLASSWVRLSDNFLNFSDYSGNYMRFLAMGPDTFYSRVGTAIDLQTVTGNGIDSVDHGDLVDYMPYGEWHRMDMWVSIPDATTGYVDEVKWWVDGQLIREVRQTDGPNQPEFGDVSDLSRIDFLPYVSNQNDSSFSIQTDDHFIDFTQARVEISDSATWDNTAQTHKELQLATSWNDITGEIEVTLNQGSFDTLEGKYLYVIDSDGNASDGYLLETSDPTPDAFTFTDITDATTSTVYTSNSITVAGINTDATISVTSGEYSINSGTWTSISGTVSLNDTVEVRHTSSASYSTETTTTLDIGGVTDIYNVTTEAEPADTTPTPFTFTDITDATTSTVYTSNSITVAGINTDTTISVTNGEYSINSGAWTSTSGTVSLNDTVEVRHTSSANYSTETTTTLDIGGVTDIYNVTTEAEPVDTTPDAFTFTDVTDATTSTLYTSNAITVTGINTDATISVTSGEYSINSGTWTSTSGTVSLNDTVEVRHTSSASYSTETTTTLDIGGVSDIYNVTTEAEPAEPVEPEVPTDPIEPIDPSEPLNPVTPIAPITPNDPEADEDGSIGNTIWNDENKNGKQDNDEPGIENIRVKLILAGSDNDFDTDDEIWRTDTNHNGHYLFENLPEGKYRVIIKEEDLTDWTQTYDPSHSENMNNQLTLDLDENDEYTKADFGYVKKSNDNLVEYNNSLLNNTYTETTIANDDVAVNSDTDNLDLVNLNDVIENKNVEKNKVIDDVVDKVDDNRKEENELFAEYSDFTSSKDEISTDNKTESSEVIKYVVGSLIGAASVLLLFWFFKKDENLN